MPSKPLQPSIKLAPLIINKKHKQTKANEKNSYSFKQGGNAILLIFAGFHKSMICLLEYGFVFKLLITFIN